ncbi:MAG: hypothetical protein ILP14_08725 [Oscillospiraceae bacterium]|nr:hypothetical protein [Oscillospiraceae bacterium]
MSKKELIEKIEKALEMVISVSGRKFTIVRDEEDWLTISEKKHQETEKHYSDTYDLVSRYKIDGNPLRNYIDAIKIEKYVALLDV